MSSNGGDGTLTIVKENAGKWEVQENVATARGARTIALDTKTHNVYLPTAVPGPPPTAGQRRGTFLPDSFKVLVVGKRLDFFIWFCFARFLLPLRRLLNLPLFNSRCLTNRRRPRR